MSWRIRVTWALESLCHLAAAAAVVVMLGVTITDVVIRKSLGISVRGVVDIVAFCVVIATMLGIAVAWSQRAHIVVDLLDMTGSPALINALDILTRVVGIVLMPLVAWLAYREFREVLDFGDRTPDIAMLYAWHWAAICIGYTLSAVLLIISPMQPARQADV